jgi:parallel beta-helix repeat protein/predicted outer membrane repeat protein
MSRTRTARTSTLRLECLEDRSVPSTFTVNTPLDDVTPANGKFSLREAITKANTTAGADTIVLPAGVFKITLAGAGEDGNLTGDLDVSDSLIIRGAGSSLTFINGRQLDRVFDIQGSAPGSIAVAVEQLQVRNGSAGGHGGGIQVGNANLIVRDSVISGNQASLTGGGISDGAAPGTGKITLVRTTISSNVAGTTGGGVRSSNNVLTLRDSTVRRNISTFFGGGISADTPNLTNSIVSGNIARSGDGGGINASTATLDNCTVSGNIAQGSDGGGIRAVTAATLTNCTVSGNFAAQVGGGIEADTATLNRSTVSGNSAGFEGGGIFAATATLTNSTVSGNLTPGNGGGINVTTANLTRTTVSGNSAGVNGGGIIATTATLTNTTISGNSAVQFGGGVSAGTATLLNCTVVENSAQGGGGLSSGVTFTLKNSLVAQNLTAFGGGPDVLGTFVSDGHNLIGIGNASFTNGVDGDIVGTSSDPIDPKLGPLANNGGRTRTHALRAGSPAIDKGDNAGLPPTDQRGAGFARKKDGNLDGIARVDIGAFER